MLGKILVLSTTLVTAALTFTVTSFATSEDTTPNLRENLPVRAILAESLAESEAIRISNLLGDLASAVGITPESYGVARRLGTPDNNSPLYLIPGARGVCLVLRASAACGDPGARGSRVNAFVTLDASGNTLIGGGVADDSVRAVEVVAGGVHRRSFPVTNGVFIVALSVPGFEPGDGVRFNVT